MKKCFSHYSLSVLQYRVSCCVPLPYLNKSPVTLAVFCLDRVPYLPGWNVVSIFVSLLILVFYTVLSSNVFAFVICRMAGAGKGAGEPPEAAWSQLGPLGYTTKYASLPSRACTLEKQMANFNMAKQEGIPGLLQKFHLRSLRRPMGNMGRPSNLYGLTCFRHSSLQGATTVDPVQTPIAPRIRGATAPTSIAWSVGAACVLGPAAHME